MHRFFCIIPAGDLADGVLRAYRTGVKKVQAIQVMSALAQETRLKVYQLLVERLPEGLAASDIADAVGMSRNGMSPHFSILSAAGLVSAKKDGRQVIYKAETQVVESLADFLARAVQRDRDGTISDLNW